MTLPHENLKTEVGVRELHDQLSRYLRHVGAGGDVAVTMRGRRVAHLSRVDDTDPWQTCVPAAWFVTLNDRGGAPVVESC